MTREADIVGFCYLLMVMIWTSNRPSDGHAVRYGTVDPNLELHSAAASGDVGLVR
jgi:hypothetical protein